MNIRSCIFQHCFLTFSIFEPFQSKVIRRRIGVKSENATNENVTTENGGQRVKRVLKRKMKGDDKQVSFN